MTENVVLFIIGQTIMLSVVIVGGFIKLNNRLTEISTNYGHIDERQEKHESRHDKLDGRVQGISRKVERHETILTISEQKPGGA